MKKIADGHPEVYIELPSVTFAAIRTLTSPAMVIKSHSNTYVFLDDKTTNQTRCRSSFDWWQARRAASERLFCEAIAFERRGLEKVISTVRTFNVQYDKDSDVLYISSRDAPASKGIEQPQGMVWRYDPRGDLIGLTLINFRDYWRSRRPDLVHDISIKSLSLKCLHHRRNIC